MKEFKQINIKNQVFDGQDLSDAKFDRCNVDHCSFKNCIMDGTIFDRSNVIVCDFTDTDITKIINQCSNFITEEDEHLHNHTVEDSIYN